MGTFTTKSLIPGIIAIFSLLCLQQGEVRTTILYHLDIPYYGNTPTSVNTSITGLPPCSLYHYRAVGVNAVGTTYANDMTFSTGTPVGPAGPISGPANVCPGGWGYVYSISAIDGITEQKIDLSPIPGGIYTVVVQSQDKCTVKNVLVMH